MDSSTIYTLDLTDAPTPDDSRAVEQGLTMFNEARVGATSWQPLGIFIRDTRGTIAGGLLGGTYWGWLYVSTLWVGDALRGQGWGTRLLRSAEEEAVRRGCPYVLLDTMSFQARPFYERHGYTVFGELDDMPAGSGERRFWLRKTLQQP